MIRVLSKGLTLEEFFECYPDGYGRYELRDGVIVKMQPTGVHEQLAGFLALELGLEIRRLNLPYIIPRQGIVKAISSNTSGFNPDVIVLDRQVLGAEPLWKKHSTITKGVTVRLAIEVVSTNWHDDYLVKLGEYEKLGILEYWIVDYLGLGGRRYVGSPKKPTFTVCKLIEQEYQIEMFQASDSIISPTFPGLEMTVTQIFKLAE